ncbi:MATE family efflux transporter [Amylibacter sp. IMCC11727]|uniref:MATE family efflux transporter n=1 Tax=Amylibacter sp. IMCC11727 TaxID=3039851 RepID=UPI00244E47DD|nr:MATE family efflux transporter [Amylibacter sp. IMCC11727]WGI22917.1 MATE family efflux transporter [Amylibacter sp. IMCC11727]
MAAMGDKARFLSGSTMRHVVVMTLTGSLGLVFMFLVDVTTLFWVSWLGDEGLVAALGFGWTIQFFTISTGIGLMIASMALVSKSIGQGKLELARQQTTSAALYTFVFQLLTAGIVLVFRREILAFAGAEGQTLEDAARFLMISVPSLPFMALGMVGSAVLRSIGDAVRSMSVTMSAGLVAMVVDPLFILGLGWGFEGAAWGIVVSRTVSAILSIWFVVRIHDMVGPVSRETLRTLFKPFVAIAIPAVMTQLSTPFGNYILTKVISAYGDAAVAGWAVVSRIAVLAFGGIFSLSGAIGGIIGQNFGAGQMDRVKQTYKDALIFCAIYTVLSWGLLILLRDPVANLFGLEGLSRDVFLAFMLIGAGGYMFAGALFVSNAAFNNLGKPIYSTFCNWFRDGILIYPCCVLMGLWLAAPGVVYGQALAAVLAGSAAMIWGWRFVGRLAAR